MIVRRSDRFQQYSLLNVNQRYIVYTIFILFHLIFNRLGGVMMRAIASNDAGVPRLGQTEDIGIEKNMDRSTPYEGKELDTHYKPKRGLVIDKCNYVFCETEVPIDCVRLVEGHDLYVPVSWITELQGTFSGKTKPHCFKLPMNGFYQPSEITNTSAMVILSTPLVKALKAYGVVKLGMDSVAITKAINTKIGTATLAIKFQRVN